MHELEDDLPGLVNVQALGQFNIKAGGPIIILVVCLVSNKLFFILTTYDVLLFLRLLTSKTLFKILKHI